MVFCKTYEEKNPVKIIEYIYDRSEKNWKEQKIDNLNNYLKNIKLSTIERNATYYAGLTSKDKLLVIYHENELFYVDLDKNKVLGLAKKEDYFIKSKNLINGKMKLFYQIEGTNNFIGINKSKQIVYLSISKNEIEEKMLIEMNKDEDNIVKIGLFKNILFLYFESLNEIKVYKLDNNNYSIQLIFTYLFISQNKLQFACVSDDCNYLATFEESKILSLFRLKNSKRIAHVPIYNEINSILMSNYYVVMCMQDKRILSFLLVDPLVPEHSNRISELDSRYYYNQSF